MICEKCKIEVEDLEAHTPICMGCGNGLCPVVENQGKPKLSNGQTAEELTARLPNPGPGRPKDTEEDKIIKRAVKELVKEYKEDLAQILPQIKPVITKKALDGDMTAIKEIHDRVMDKSKQPTDITSDGEKINQLLVQFLNGKEANDNRDTGGVSPTV